uniref:Zinc finger and BTB domain-containing protein 6 n=1 Tax=Melanaphis sacchari TaxID=742174 RepID=A0A2H8TXZ9_9HEMI
MMNFGGSKSDQSLSSVCQNMFKNTPIVEKLIRVRCSRLPGDSLSTHKPSDSSISNICDMPVNNPPNDDTNSINKNDFIKHNVFENSEQSSHMLLSNQCDETSVNLNINHGSNDGRFPLSSCNFDVENLKKDKVNALKIISSASGNNDLNMWMKTKTSCELVPPSSEISLEAGQQIVNNGIPIDSTIYLIDTTYTKDYDKKVRDLPMNVMKTKLAFNEMSALPRLLGLFKCMDRTCTKIFNSKELFKLHMKLHFSNTEKKKKNQIYNVEQFKMCAYCFKMFDDEESLANHIVDNYTFCEYFCPYCFYRAYTASHVLVHQSIIHTKISKHSIIKLEYNDDACKYPKEMLMVVDFKDFVLPYKCSVGYCAFSCYLHNEFIDHLNEEHQLCDKFCCYICDNKDDGEGFFALQSNLMITHFKLHNLNKYQCIFCLFGCEIIDSMIKHLAFEHFEYEPLCLERSTVSDNCDSKNIKNLKILKLKKVIENGMIEVVNLPVDTVSSLPEVLPQKSKKRSVECSDVLSVAMKSACIDEGSQPLDTIVITVPDSAQMAESSTSLPLAIDNEFIMIDDVNENDMQESLKINCIWSESKNKEKRKVSSNNDVIVIDDEDETNLLEKEELESPKKRMCLEKGESTNGSIKVKRLAFPIIELDKLFVCKECEKIFSNGDIYHAHLNVCPFWDSVAGQKCMYCVKVFKTPLNMSEHIKLHGPDRFKCYLCSLNVPSQRAITHHMKNSHGITNLDFVPERSNLTDLNKDNFIVYENKIVEQKKQKIHNLFSCNKCSFKGNSRKIIMSHMKAVHNTEQNLDFDGKFYKTMQELPNDVNNSDNSLIPQQNKQQITTLKRKRSTNFGYQKGLPKTKHLIKDKTKNLCFSPDTIDSIPKSHIFSDLIGCSLCTYNTKVRSNLILHLNGHIKGQDNTTKEIVNPVPSIGKSELMFDKMINLSASSFDAMNTDKMKRDELDKKIVEVAPDDNFKTDVFPQFVPESKRYKCSIPLCDHICMTEEMLKTHISILHSDYQCYICPHCQPSCIISKTVERNQIEFHLMHHGENLYKCQYCEYIDFNRVEMKTHMRNTHLSEITNSVQSNIIVIRQTMLKDSCIDRGRSKAPSNVPQWVCNICSTGLRYTENEITSHIFMAHKVSSMYKCPMCQFENKDDNASTFEEHYKLKHPSVAVKCLRVFEMITDKEELHQQRSGGAENILEQQALESIEPTLVPPTCRGIPIESTPLKINNKPRGMSKSPKSATKSSSIQAHKQKMLIDVFNKNDKLGEISSNGFFVCPKCNKFEISSIELFREHLYKEINYKTWKCLKCFEISDSPKKMAWHVKKHGIGSKYEKIEDEEKLKWVNRVIGHQHFLLTEFNKNSKEKRVKSVETNKSVVNNKKTSYSPVKKKNIEREKKVVFISQPNPDPVLNDNIINLVDDSDDE